VVKLVVRNTRLLPEADEPSFVGTVRAAFAHRRKTLFNSLRDEGRTAERITLALAHAGIEPSRRAETLTLGEFAALARALG
jgi:16S rRNA (adenine1518-N6/adenine1519-N6)-dimethyltransferase